MNRWLKYLLIAMWGLFLLIGSGTLLMFFLIAKGKIGYMPPIEDLQNPIDKYASQVISEDGQLLGSYALKNNNRIYITYQDLSPALVNALISTEDVRFTEHSGIDMRGFLRAVVKTGLMRQKNAGGGSTITQQLAKQLYSPSADSKVERLLQKPIEWVIAVELERYYTKEEIINLYLNKFDFLYQAVGIESACKTYFDVKPRDLKTEQAALLVGMCKNPSLYNPVRYPERAMQRRNVVLDQMRKAGHLTAVECDSLKNIPVELRFRVRNHREGLATYFREHLKQVLMADKPERSKYQKWQKDQYERDSVAWATDPLYGWCKKNKKSNGEHYNLYTDGLKIYTGINAIMQRYAEEAVREHLGNDLQKRFEREKKGRSYAPYSRNLSTQERAKILRKSLEQSDRYRKMKADGKSEKEIDIAFDTPTEMNVFTWKGYKDTVMTPRDSILYYKGFLRSGFMAMDNLTGQVKAYVGGIDYTAFQYDMVSLGRRQVGSVMKPFLYSMAMGEGFTPCDEMLHVPQSITTEAGTVWTPKNTRSTRVGEMVSINWGLQMSDNWVTAWLMSHLSPYAFVDLLRSFGITGHLDPVPSICLGTPDISVSEMVSGYSAFANGGLRVAPLLATRIEDQYGNVLATFQPKMYEVLSAEAAYKTLYMLRNVMDGGTGSRVRYRYNVKAPMGGKTGTSQRHADGWFMCFTPSLSTGCWVGGEDPDIHFDTIADGQGASMALPIVALFMQKIYNDKVLKLNPNEDFNVPEMYRSPCRNLFNLETEVVSEGVIDSDFSM